MAVEHASARPSISTLRTSFVYNLIAHKNPYYFYNFISEGSVSVNPRHGYADFAEDSTFTEKVSALKKLGIPIALIHIVQRKEIRAGKEYLWTFGEARDQGLLNSLERILGTKAIEMRPFLDAGLTEKQIHEIGVTDTDDHPSYYGNEVYGRAVSRMLRANGYLPPN